MLIDYVDGPVAGGRRPRLYFVRNGEVRKFAGESIDGWCVVLRKWRDDTMSSCGTSHLFIIELAPDVKPLELLSPLYGIWGQDFKSWDDVVSHLRLPVDVVRGIVGDEYPETAARLDEIAAFASVNDEFELVNIVFGSSGDASFWVEPKSAVSSSGRVVVAELIDCEVGWRHGNVRVPDDCKVVDVRYSREWTVIVQVAVPVGGGADVGELVRWLRLLKDRIAISVVDGGKILRVVNVIECVKDNAIIITAAPNGS